MNERIGKMTEKSQPKITKKEAKGKHTTENDDERKWCFDLAVEALRPFNLFSSVRARRRT